VLVAGRGGCVIGSPFLAGRDRYERLTEGCVDNTHDDAFTHSVRIADDDSAVELSAVCTPPPGYEVRRARARVIAGDADPSVAEAFVGLAGARMVAGFTRRLIELGGGRPGAGLLVDAGVEVARLARQTAKLPAVATAGLGPSDAARCWELDTTGWADLPDSCFTYSPAGRAIIGTRPVTVAMGPEIYGAAPGGMGVFVRKRVQRLVRSGRRLHLLHSMHDNVHGFDIHYEIDLDSARISAAGSIASRLPYMGICSEPQDRIRSMIGQPVDGLLRKRMQGLIGGSSGCGQIYDLTADLLKLLALP
jgi:hypothetical protein